MRLHNNFLVLVLIAMSVPSIHAQSTQNRWQLVCTIPESGIESGQLHFADSLHGYFVGQHQENQWHSWKSYKEWVFYRTIDGGTTWAKIDFARVFGADASMYDSSVDDFGVLVQASSGSGCVVSNAWIDNSLGSLTFYHSTNNGDGWTTFRTAPLTLRGMYSVEALRTDDEIVLLRRENDAQLHDAAGKFFVSHDGGASIWDVRWDSTLLRNLSLGGFDLQDRFKTVNNHTFGISNDSTWVLTVSDTNNGVETTDLTRPYSLVTLLSTSAGNKWTAYRNNIPGFPSNKGQAYFYQQTLRGTPYVYLFTGTGWNVEPWAVHGTNYIYSSDYGRTWAADSTFGGNRRGFCAAAPGDVWSLFTARDSVEPGAATRWIAHTTDFGARWDIDSSSLYGDLQYDAKTVTFSDARHGWIFALPVGAHTNVAIFKYSAETNGVESGPLFKSYDVNYQVYPNPAHDNVTIQLLYSPKIVAVGCYDILGRRITPPQQVGGDNGSVSIETKSLSPGVYVADITLARGAYHVPFVVSH